MKVESVPLSRLKPDLNNRHVHPPVQLDRMVAILKRYGQRTKPLLVDKNGIVRCGNLTLAALSAIGTTQAWVTRADDLSDDDLRALAIADNRASEDSTWDVSALIADLNRMDGDILSATGFTTEDLAQIMASIDRQEEEPPTPQPPDDPVTKQGDSWILGKHRLLCGDSAKSDDVDRLIDGSRVNIINMDPPYNVNIEPSGSGSLQETKQRPQRRSWRNYDEQVSMGVMKKSKRQSRKQPTKQRAKDRKLTSDSICDEEYNRRLLAWFGNAARLLLPGCSFYIWGGFANILNYRLALLKCGLRFSQTIAWIKNNPVISRKDFMLQHELCFYGWKPGAAHKFYGPKNVRDVWNVQNVPHQKMVHLTEKPVELARRAISYSSKPGDCVLDLFGGSGSTLMAAEQLNRRAFLMEIDEPYCDVIVRRWMDFTKKDALLIRADGKFSGRTLMKEESDG